MLAPSLEKSPYKIANRPIAIKNLPNILPIFSSHRSIGAN